MKTHLIYSNDPFTAYGETEDMKREMRECKDLPEEECISDDDLWQWIDGAMELDWEDFESDLKRAPDPCSWLVVGTIGTWQGPHRGGQVFGSLQEAVRLMMRDADAFTLQEDCYGQVTATGHHHDGANHFELYRITERGEDWRRNHSWSSRETICETLYHRKGFHRAARLRELFGWINPRRVSA